MCRKQKKVPDSHTSHGIWHGIVSVLFVFEYWAAKENRAWRSCAGAQSLITHVSTTSQGTDTRVGLGTDCAQCCYVCVLRICGSGSEQGTSHSH